MSLRLFGDFCLMADGIPRRFATRKAKYLIAYLVLAGTDGIRREKALGALWPDVEEGKARGQLSTTLWRVQKSLSGLDVAIHCRGSWLYLDAPSLYVDVREFRQLVESSLANREARLANVERAVSLYTGELLEGVDEEWCELERGHLRATYSLLLKELVVTYRERADYQRAVDIARQIVELDQLDEDAHRELMLLLHLQGNRTGALAQYHALHRILQAELGVSPETRTLDLWQYIRSGAERPSTTRRSSSRSIWDALPRAPMGPIVGRDEELNQILQGLTDAVHGRGTLVVVSGEAGIGKTRLLGEIEVEARLRGFEVLKGCCTAVRVAAPYQAFIEAVWPRISRKMHSDTPEVLRDFLGRLSPALRRRKTPLRTTDVENAVVNESLLGLLSGEAPALLVLEDFQHGDQATKNLIHLLAGRLGSRRMMVLVSVRTPFRRHGSMPELLALKGVTEIRLEPLNRSQTFELIRVRLHSRSVALSVLSSIWDRTAGNPFAIIEYVHFLTERGQLTSGDGAYWTWANSGSIVAQMPGRLQVLLRERIEALNRKARKVLFAAAVLGHEGDLLLLQKLSHLGGVRFAEVVGQLFEYGLLVETSRGYRFAHESYRLATLSELPGVSRRLLHRLAADLIERVWPAKTEDLAWHFHEAGDGAKAGTYAETSGDKARAVHANEDALKWYSKSLEWLGLSTEEPQEREHHIRIVTKRQEVYELLGQSRLQLADLDEVIRCGTVCGDSRLIAQCLCTKARCLSRMNRNAEGLRSAAAARRHYSSLNDSIGQAQAHEVSALLFINLRDARRARKAYEEALELFQASDDSQGAARAVLGMGTLMLFTGENEEGLARLERAEATLARSRDRRDYARALLQKGVFCRCLGQAERSESLLTQGIDLMRKSGDRVGEARGLSQLAYTHMTLGQLRKAFHEARRSIQLVTEAGDTRGQIVFRNNAGHAVYRCLGDFGRAQRAVREAMSLVRTGGREENQAIYYDTMAAILYDQEQYPAAYKWAKEGQRLYKRWLGQFDYVGAEIEFHLGAIALALGRVGEAHESLSQAVRRWEGSHDRALLARGVSLLGLTALAEGDLSRAVEYANRSTRLLRNSKGVEELQQTYWAQATVYRSVGLTKRSTRAFERAYGVVIGRSSMLKGRLRRAYLAIPANRRIVADHALLGSAGKHGASVYQETVQNKPRIQQTEGILERRERLLDMILRGDLRRRLLAERLVVRVENK